MKKLFKGKIKLLISLTFLALFIFNTVAYSGLATKLAITSEAMFRPNVDIRITDIKLYSATNGAVESYSPKYNVDSTTTGFTLPNANSEITYKVTVTNYGNVRQTIYEFIKNSVNSDDVNIKITDFTPVCADTKCNTKNSDFTIVHYEGENSSYNNKNEFLITFTTSNPSSTPINVIENYSYRPVYKIDFDANGGQNAPSSIYKVFGESINLPTTVPTKSSYDFLGWSKSSTSTTAEYKAGALYEPTESINNEEDKKNIKDIILYAVWQQKQAKLDLNYNIDGTWYYSGYNNKILTGIKVNGEDKGYLNDFSGTYDYGTSYEIYGFKIDGVEIPYSKKYTVDGTNHLEIYFNTINFTANDANLGSVTPTQLIVIPGTTYKVSNNVITLFDGRIATASPKTVTGYTTKFSSYTITPNSTTINAKTTAQANFTKEANTYTITLDNKSATTAGTPAIYEKYTTGIYLDSALKNAMTTSANPITKPAKTGYTFKGYYTKENGQGDQIINADGYITDKITNTTYTTNTTLYAYYKDETNPTLTLTNSSNGNWTNKDVTITLNGADSGSGIKEYQWKENGTWTTRAIAITNGVGSITYTVDRNLEIEFRAIDNAGNISDTKTTYVRRDTVAPKIELNGAASSSEINNNSVTIPIKITETASGINNSEFTTSDISVLVNGTIVNPSTKTLTYNSVSNGVYSYTLTLNGITLNGKITLEIAAGAVKDIATNPNAKTTLDPSITVSNTYTISLNGNGATTAGTPAIYEKYNTGIYLDSALTKAMTTSANTITKPTRSYTVSFNANNTGITVPSAITKSYSYSGHYTDASAGTQMINENGYITSSFKNTSYTSNGTLCAHWKAKPSVTIPAISKTGYTCSWNTSADGKGTTYNAGDVTDKLNTQTLYAVCKANSYTVSYNSNGGSGTMANDTATYDSNFITKKNTFTKTGYTFNGWNEKADGTGTVWGLTSSGMYESGKTWKWTYTKNITLYAQWKANTNTKYVVKHYKQKLDGTYPSEADDTDNLTGTTDSSVSPAVKDVKNNSNYIGFTAPSVQTVTIAGDGSTVVTYKYTRNKYTFTLGSTTGITTTGSTASGSYYYGSTITLKAAANTGYTFNGWTSSNTSLVANQTNASATFTMPAGNITMTPSATAKSLTFNDQSFNRTYNPTTDQKVGITAATGGSGSYSYTITSGNTSYFSISGTSITVKAGTPANTYTLKVLAKDTNTKATKEATITIVVDKKTTSAPVSPTVKIYNAAAQNHGITIPEGASIVESKSTLSAINVGTYNVVFTLNSNYKWNSNITGDITVPWIISEYNINNATIESIEDQTYIPGDEGVKPKPKVTVPIPSGKTTTLVEGTDFTYSYYGNLNAGTATVSITGKGNYTSYKNATFKIVKAENPIKVTANDLTYNTQAQALVKTSNAQGNVCYSLKSALTSCDTANNIPTATEAGTYTVYYYVKGNTNYKFKAGSVLVTIKKYNLSNATISGLSNKTYNGSAQTQSGFTVTVPIPTGHPSTPTYTTSYSNNTNVGTATMTLTGTGNYTGTKSATFTIGKSSDSGTVTANALTYNAQAQNLVSSSNVKGYICYSLSSAPTSCTANSAIPQGTNAGTYKVYYLISGNSNYNSKSDSVNVTIKQYDISKNATIGSVGDQKYTGSAITPTPSVTVPIPSGKTTTLVNGTDFTYGYSNNTSVGTGTINVTGKGNYTGTKSTTFKIAEKASSCTITSVPTLKYPSNVTGTIKYSCTGDGAITVSSANTGIITVSNASSTSATLTALKAGTTKITVSQAAGNYAASSVSADVTVTYSTYTVTLDGNGATKQGNTSAVATYNSTTLSAITLPERSYKITYNMGTTGITKPDDGKANYTFTGWYTSKYDYNGIKVANNAATPALEASVSGYTNASKQWTRKGEATLYAHWSANSTKIAEIQKEGYSCYWNTSSNGSGASYESGQTVDTIASDITLYPICSINQYVLTVNPNGGTWQSSTSASTITRNYGTTTTIYDPIRNGYKFTGWTLTGKGSLSGTTYKFGAGAGTLTANWKVNELSFDDQTFDLTYNKTTSFSLILKEASNGSGSYSYTITSGNNNGYFILSGTSITVKAGTPANTYTLKVLATDTNTKAAKEVTITIIVDQKEIDKYVVSTYKVYNAAYQNHGITIPEGLYIDESKSALSAINAGEYTIVLKLNSNYKWKNETTREDLTVSWYITAYNINNATIESIKDQTYIPGDEGVKPKPKVTVPIPSGKTTTLVEGKDFTYSYFGNFNVGNATVSITGMGNYSSYKNATFKIVQAENSVKVEPIKQPNGKNLVYNTQAQTLVTTSNAQGNVCYSLESALTSCDTANNIPTATDAGTYTVYYYVKGNTNYKFKAGSVQVTIDKYNLSNATISGLSNKTYNGSAQTQSGFTVTVPIPSGKTSTPTYTTSYSNNTNVGTATMTLTGTGNYTGTKSATFTIGKATNPGTVTAKSLSYTGKAQELVSSNNVKGYICYSLSSIPTSCSANSTIPQGTNAGTYKVYYLISGDNNYNSKSGTVNVTIGRVNAVCPTVSVSSTTITYDGQPHEVGISGGSGGTIQYRTSTTASWTTTKPTITNAGEMTTYVQVAGDSNHNTIDCGNKKIIIGKRATTCTTASASKDYNGTALTANSGTCTNLVSGHSATVSASGTITNAGSTANTYKGAVIKNGAAEVTTNYSITGANGTLTVRKVSAQNPTLTAYSGTYDGQSHTISVSGGSGGTIQYSTDNKTWSTTKPTRTNVGTTTVYVKVVGDGNHTDTNPISSTITITAQQLPAPTNLTITTAGIVTWGNVSNATKYQISIDGTNWTDATSGVDYLSKIIASTGTRTVYVRAVGTGNYSNSKDNGCTASKSVYAVTINSNSTTMGKVDTSSYNVIEEATYSTSSNKLSFIGVTTGTTTKTLKTVTATSNTGYHFGSWSSASGSITSNATLTANFVANTYTVKFASNGGTGTMADQTFTYGKAATLTANTFTKTGYTFAGWTSSDGNVYSDKQSVSNLTSTHNGSVTLTALWKAKEITITLKDIDNATIISTETDSSGNSIERNTTLYAVYNDGIYLDEKHSKKMTTSTNGITKLKINYTLVCMENYSGGNSEPISIEYPFLGYYKEQDSQTTKLIDSNGMITSAFTSTTFSDDATIYMQRSSKSTSLPSKERSNYVFEGWFTESNGGDKVDSNTDFLSKNISTVYAHWISSPKITGGSTNWVGEDVSISLEAPSESDTGTVSYEYVLTDSTTAPTDGWESVTDPNGIVEISIPEDENGNYKELQEQKYIFYRAISPADSNIKLVSNYQKINIDTIKPSVTLKAFQTGTTTEVESNTWINKYLEFMFGDVTSGPSGATIYYCIDDSSTDDNATTCDPTGSSGQIGGANQAIPVELTNTKEGQYVINYVAVSATGYTSDVNTFVAKVDVTAPTLNVRPSVINTEKAYDIVSTNTSTVFTSTDWVIDGYNFDTNDETNPSTDNLSGIASITIQYNAAHLKASDDDYRTIVFNKDMTEAKDFDITASGFRYVIITMTDEAGNSSKIIFKVRIDNVEPTVTITATNKAGTPVPSGKISSTGLTYTVTAKSGLSGYTIYTCRDDDNECDPSNAATPNQELKITAFASQTSWEKYIRAKAISGSGVVSDIEFHYTRVGSSAVDIEVRRVDNNKQINSKKWTNSKIKFKLVPTEPTATLKYCVLNSGPCTPNITVKANQEISINRTGVFYISYSATSASTGITSKPNPFIAKLDVEAPTVKVSAYKLDEANLKGTGAALKTVTDSALSITTWRKFGYYFMVDADDSLSKIASMKWSLNEAGNVSLVKTFNSTTTYDTVHNVYISSSGLRYGEITIKDKAGNSTTIPIDVRIDKVEPTPIIEIHKNDKDKTLLRTVTDDYRTSGWVNYTYLFDLSKSKDLKINKMTASYNAGGSNKFSSKPDDDIVGATDITSTKTFTVTGEGARYVKFKMWDLAGNYQEKYVKMFIDLTAPTLKWGNVDIDNNNKKLTFHYTCSDSMSGVVEANKTETLSSTGTVTGVCQDKAGNKKTVTSDKWYYSQDESCGSTSKENCQYQDKYLGLDSSSSCEGAGRGYCSGGVGYHKCHCYSKTEKVLVCGAPTITYNTCWHK